MDHHALNVRPATLVAWPGGCSDFASGATFAGELAQDRIKPTAKPAMDIPKWIERVLHSDWLLLVCGALIMAAMLATIGNMELPQ